MNDIARDHESEKSLSISANAINDTGDSDPAGAAESGKGSAGQTEKIKKKDLVRKKIDAARNEVDSIDIEMNRIRLSLSKKITDFEHYLNEKFADVLRESRRVLSAVGRKDIPEIKISLENPFTDAETDGNLEINDLPAGYTTAFALSLFAAAVVLLLFYFIGIPDRSGALIPDMNRLREAASNIGTIAGLGPSAGAGASLAIISSILAGWIVFAVTVMLRTSRNLRRADALEDEALKYREKKAEAIEKTKEVLDHLGEIENIMHKYMVLLDEKNAVMRRSLLLEGTSDFKKLHSKTQETVRDMIRLMRAVKELIEIPYEQSGHVDPSSLQTLQRHEVSLAHYIDRLYADSSKSIQQHFSPDDER